ncbi:MULTISPECIES: hypothetical protein [unclassified Aeromonas]|uniref:hypothetical protein n=1 Tax=unclassified Aeromonas TaxID=257493 RepID=UPI00084B5A2F|nr:MULTISPECIES: hypothetical protein [unclassified Aeromonas]OEC48738.1 hypothetical protein A9G04_20875 [Aeromonas sp. ANNP30]OEC60779.1 hypothetical protein A9G49_20940 [Aeromonas sp. ANP5]
MAVTNQITSYERKIIETYGLTMYTFAITGHTKSKIYNWIKKYDIKVPEMADVHQRVTDIVKQYEKDKQ